MRLLPLLIALFILGCGSSSEGPKTPKQRFAGTCGSCHTLADAGTKGTFGPNLDELKPDKARVLQAIAQGPGGMPDGLLEGEAADEVGGYVAAVAGR
jgi:mono/diheme cytochrome c family protein